MKTRFCFFKKTKKNSSEFSAHNAPRIFLESPRDCYHAGREYKDHLVFSRLRYKGYFYYCPGGYELGTSNTRHVLPRTKIKDVAVLMRGGRGRVLQGAFILGR